MLLEIKWNEIGTKQYYLINFRLMKSKFYLLEDFFNVDENSNWVYRQPTLSNLQNQKFTPTIQHLSDDEELFDLIEDIYKDEFKLFHETYPITTIRKNGFKASLRENKKQCKELYIQTIRDKKITTSLLQRCLEYYLEDKKKGS